MSETRSLTTQTQHTQNESNGWKMIIHLFGAAFFGLFLGAKWLLVSEGVVISDSKKSSSPNIGDDHIAKELNPSTTSKISHQFFLEQNDKGVIPQAGVSSLTKNRFSRGKCCVTNHSKSLIKIHLLLKNDQYLVISG